MLLLSAAIAMSLCQAAFAETVEMNLDDAMQRAFNTNPAISIADYNVKAAKASYDAAKQSRFGSISARHNFDRGGSNSYRLLQGEWTKGLDNSVSSGVSASVPIYTGGAKSGSIKSAKAGYRSALAGKQSAFNDMRATVTDGYFTVLQTDNLQKLGKESVDRLQDHLKNVQAQYDVGVVAKVDVLRSQVELSDAEQSLIKYQNAHEVAVANLDKIVGLPLDTELKLDNILVYTPYANDLDYCLDYASKHRPELEQAKQRVEAAHGSLLVARSGYQPSISASASQSWSGEHGFASSDNRNWGVGIGVSMTIFDNGVTFAKIHGAKADLASAEEAYRDTVDSINLDVRSTYLSMREAEKRIHTTDVAVERAQEDYRIAQLRYQAGVGTNTDVIDASVALTNAQVNYLQALYDYNMCKTDLQNAIGEPMYFPTNFTVEMSPKTEIAKYEAKKAAKAAKKEAAKANKEA